MNKNELIEFLKENLTVRVDTTYWTCPNERKITISLENEEICSTTFDVADKPEYDDH